MDASDNGFASVAATLKQADRFRASEDTLARDEGHQYF
jgi:hypothetical protein